MAFDGAEQAVQDVPHVAVLEFDTQLPPQSWKPALHAIPQLVPLQVAVPFPGTGQAVQDVPHVAVLEFDTHVPPQLWNPALHAIPQLVPLQVAVPFGGTGHAAHDVVPQFATLLFDTQTAPQR